MSVPEWMEQMAVDITLYIPGLDEERQIEWDFGDTIILEHKGRRYKAMWDGRYWSPRAGYEIGGVLDGMERGE